LHTHSAVRVRGSAGRVHGAVIENIAKHTRVKTSIRSRGRRHLLLKTRIKKLMMN
jgi:hypothetical protein